MDDSRESGLRKFVAPEFVFGEGASSLAAQYLANLGSKRPLLVTDAGLMKAGWAGILERELKSAGFDFVVFDQVTPNPRDHEVMAGARVYNQGRCDALLALGGGSVLDCAKGIGVVNACGRHILEFEGVDTVDSVLPPLVCIPSTAGSAADVSQFAIINDTGRRVKIALVSKLLVPDVSLIDPRLTTTMSAQLTAETGLDTLTHAIEAYVSNANSPITDLFAIEAMRLVRHYLVKAVNNPNDLTARSKMCLACLDAGLAFSNAILGAVHSMAHSLGGSLDLPHGECNAILLGPVIGFNFPAAPERYRDVAIALGCAVAGLPDDEIRDVLLSTITQLRADVGISQNLGALGVKREEIPHLAALAVKDPCLLTNPRRPTQADLEAIYEAAL